MPPNLHHRDGHHGWDRDQLPLLEIDAGDEVEVVLADCFDGQLDGSAGAAEVAALDLDRANPLTGPIAIRGAEPGAVLAIEILELEVGDMGWTTLIPGFGLLADDFPEPHVVHSRIDGQNVSFGDVARLPAEPFLGTVGLAPAVPGRHSVIPPRRVGGNLDCRDVRAGATLLLPVEVPGGLLSLGDPHATQGDGEVCGTAIETAAAARIRIELRRERSIADPQVASPAPVSRPDGPRHLTTGVGSDLYEGARAATRAMIDHLEATFGLTAPDAYALCSVAAHLRIIEIVDAPNWVVGLELDTSVVASAG